jgi:hypothetical protein
MSKSYQDTAIPDEPPNYVRLESAALFSSGHRRKSSLCQLWRRISREPAGHARFGHDWLSSASRVRPITGALCSFAQPVTLAHRYKLI